MLPSNIFNFLNLPRTSFLDESTLSNPLLSGFVSNVDSEESKEHRQPDLESSPYKNRPKLLRQSTIYGENSGNYFNQLESVENLETRIPIDEESKDEGKRDETLQSSEAQLIINERKAQKKKQRNLLNKIDIYESQFIRFGAFSFGMTTIGISQLKSFFPNTIPNEIYIDEDTKLLSPIITLISTAFVGVVCTTIKNTIFPLNKNYEELLYTTYNFKKTRPYIIALVIPYFISLASFTLPLTHKNIIEINQEGGYLAIATVTFGVALLGEFVISKFNCSN